MSAPLQSKSKLQGRLALVVCSALTIMTSCARHSDRDWLLREFDVPQEVELTVNSTPEDDSNWADRKNLEMNATFKFTPTQLLTYTRELEGKSADWHALPISTDLKNQLTTRLNSQKTNSTIKKAAHGFYLLKSARGQNLLKTTKRGEWNPDDNELELAILNADSAEMKVFVRQ